MGILSTDLNPQKLNFVIDMEDVAILALFIDDEETSVRIQEEVGLGVFGFNEVTPMDIARLNRMGVFHPTKNNKLIPELDYALRSLVNYRYVNVFHLDTNDGRFLDFSFYVNKKMNFLVERRQDCYWDFVGLDKDNMFDSGEYFLSIFNSFTKNFGENTYREISYERHSTSLTGAHDCAFKTHYENGKWFNTSAGFSFSDMRPVEVSSILNIMYIFDHEFKFNPL